MEYEVSIEKRMYATGKITVDCDNPDQAIEMVMNQINNGVLKAANIKWSKPQYEDGSFWTTGDVS